MKPNLAEVSTGALTLLVIALEKDRDKLMFGNAAFRLSYEVIGRLPEHCASAPKSLIEHPVSEPNTAGDMFLASCQLVDHLSRELLRQPNRIGSWKGSSEFDHPALLALAQTISISAGTQNGVHAGYSAGISRLASTSRRDLQCAFVTNYVGNLLQDYFDAAEIWRTVPNLPEDTAGKLRTHDATVLGRIAFAEFPPSSSCPPDEVVAAMQRVSSAVFLEHRDRS